MEMFEVVILWLSALVMFFQARQRAVRIRISMEESHHLEQLLHKGCKVDATHLSTLKEGARRLLEKPQERAHPNFISPSDEIEKLSQECEALDLAIDNKTTEMKENHKNYLQYQDDETIVEYYRENEEMLVAQMRNMLKKGV